MIGDRAGTSPGFVRISGITPSSVPAPPARSTIRWVGEPVGDDVGVLGGRGSRRGRRRAGDRGAVAGEGAGGELFERPEDRTHRRRMGPKRSSVIAWSVSTSGPPTFGDVRGRVQLGEGHQQVGHLPASMDWRRTSGTRTASPASAPRDWMIGRTRAWNWVVRSTPQAIPPLGPAGEWPAGRWPNPGPGAPQSEVPASPDLPGGCIPGTVAAVGEASAA